MTNIDAVDTTSLASYLPPPVKRHCANPDCRRKLASLNKGDLCFACQRKVDLEFYTVTYRRYASDGAAIPMSHREQTTNDIRLQQAVKRRLNPKDTRIGNAGNSKGFKSRTPDEKIIAVLAERDGISKKELVAKYKLSPWTVGQILLGRITPRGTPLEYAQRCADLVACEYCKKPKGELCIDMGTSRTNNIPLHLPRKRALRIHLQTVADAKSDPNPGTGE